MENALTRYARRRYNEGKAQGEREARSAAGAFLRRCGLIEHAKTVETESLMGLRLADPVSEISAEE